MVEHVQVSPEAATDRPEIEVAGPYQRGLVAGALIYFLGAATGLALVATLIAAVAFDIAPILAVPLVARQRRAFARLCWLAVAVTVPAAIAFRAYAGLAILPTAPLLALAAFRGPRRWRPARPPAPLSTEPSTQPPVRPPVQPAHLAAWTALVAAAGAGALLLVEAACGAF